MAKNPYADAGRSDSPPSFFDTMDPSATMDKRGTELIADPRSFSAPRPAPRAPSRYTITSRRSGASNYTPGMESRASMDSRMITPHRPPGLEVLESTEDEYEESETQDFSRPSKDFSRPYSSADMRTLPSLYDPPTGAERYTATSEMISPRSRYPPSERGRESVGAALGSGVGAGGRVRDLKRESEERYYARMDMPALPRGVSDESR